MCSWLLGQVHHTCTRSVHDIHTSDLVMLVADSPPEFSFHLCYCQVVSVMHHHLSDHHMTGQYIPTDFFETSAMIITLILMGKYLECAAKGKTSEAITKVWMAVCSIVYLPPLHWFIFELHFAAQQLLRLAPDTATVVELATDGSITSTQIVPSHLIHRGDIIQVWPPAHYLECLF